MAVSRRRDSDASSALKSVRTRAGARLAEERSWAAEAAICATLFSMFASEGEEPEEDMAAPEDEDAEEEPPAAGLVLVLALLLEAELFGAV